MADVAATLTVHLREYVQREAAIDFANIDIGNGVDCSSRRRSDMPESLVRSSRCRWLHFL